MSKVSGLESLVQEIRACRICVDTENAKRLPHEPRPVLQISASAKLCICGQAPGIRVHKSGQPFTDPSGDRLRDWLGVDEETFYNHQKIAIVPMGFCFPGNDAKGGDLPPRRECKATWHDKVFTQLQNIELVLAIGQYAQAYHLGTEKRANLTETVKAWRCVLHANENRRFNVLPLPHPSWRNNAWLKKNTWFEEAVLPFLKTEVARLIR